MQELRVDKSYESSLVFRSADQSQLHLKLMRVAKTQHLENPTYLFYDTWDDGSANSN